MYHAPQELRTYFLTFVTASRRRLFQVEANAALMLNLLQTSREKGRFELHAFAIMPDHMHLLLTPSPDISLEKAVQFIKGGFSFQFKSKLEVWERGYNESQIRSAEKFDACRLYIEQNPVRARLVEKATRYPFSSAGKPEWVDKRPRWFEAKTQG